MNFQNTKAIYLQIADFICEQILLKKWRENDKIPSIRELAINLQVNPNTVTRTYAFLEQKNIIKMQRGVGYFVAEQGYNNVLEVKKSEFLTEALPQLFKSMDLLNITIEDFKKIYNVRRKYEKE